jgi:hypothetical protein
MTDLTPEDEALLARAREGLEPRAEDHARIKRALVLQIAAGTVAATAALSTSAEAAGTISAAGGFASGGVFSVLAKVIGVGVLSAAIAGAGLVAVTRTSSRPSPSRVSASSGGQVPGPPVSPAPVQRAVEGLPSSPVETGVPAVPSANAPSGGAQVVDGHRNPPLPPTRSSAGASTPPSPSADTDSTPAAPVGPSTLPAEAALLRRAGAALKAGDPGQALDLIGQHASSFPDGVLIEEREAERIVILCALGRISDARAAAAMFLRDRPRSPMAERVRASCGAP